MPQVSVIVPLYNKECTIQRTLNSVFAQTTGDWELIVVDDGSTDDSAALVQPYLQDERVRLLYQDNRGPGAARNEGIWASNAKTVACLDADDWWEPAYLEIAIEALEDNPLIAAVNLAYAFGSEQPPGARWMALGVGVEPWSISNVRPSVLKSHLLATHSSATVVRREFAKEVGGFYSRDKCTYGEDSWFWFRLITHGYPILHIGNVLAHWTTDASDLDDGRQDARPLHPYLLHPKEAVSGLTPGQRSVALRFLRWEAVYRVKWALRERNLSQTIQVSRTWMKLVTTK